MITGAVLIGAAELTTDESFRATDPSTGALLDPGFGEAGIAEVEQACALAEASVQAFSNSDPEIRARFLEAIADQITGIGDALIERAMAETGLPRARLEGERARTIGQLGLFAAVVREGEWIHATIDTALPARQPLPRPDLRRRHVALGPVAVFGASNFPLAFSVAGGDTASAFAAGCPVIAKGHPAHPGTSELVARAIIAAVAAIGLPAGIFSYLPGSTKELGGALVADRRICAVGFTGSRSGGVALMRIAAGRAEPIPVYAEMSSINPVILFPAALARRGAELAIGFVQSLTLGAGQFCTNPGLVIAVASPDLDAFVAAAEAALAGSAAQQMLSPDIHASFERGVKQLGYHEKVRTVGRSCEADAPNQGRGALFITDSVSFLADPTLRHEVFGASSIIVAVPDMAEAQAVIAGLEGQLTATLQMDAEDEPFAAALLPTIERKVGRVLANGWPTGVEVSHAMVHGGPYPATSDGRSTSVGALAIERFLRPVCYQNLSDALLPAPLRADNPWAVSRRVDGIVEAAGRACAALVGDE